MTPRSVKLLLADDHDVVREGLRSILEAQEGWKVCAVAPTGKEAVQLASLIKPDIAVLDLLMPDMDGLEATRQIKKAQPEVEVLIFTMHDTEYLIREVFTAGASAFVLKSEGGRKLVEAIEAVLQHKAFLTDKTSETLLKNFLKPTPGLEETSPLTRRERELLQLLASGKSNKEASVALGISVKTVETHRAAIMRKLGFSSVAELVRYAVRERLIRA